jgi:hypothetical protein
MFYPLQRFEYLLLQPHQNLNLMQVAKFKTVPVIVAAFAFGVAPIADNDNTPPSA